MKLQKSIIRICNFTLKSQADVRVVSGCIHDTDVTISSSDWRLFRIVARQDAGHNATNAYFVALSAGGLAFCQVKWQ